MEFKIQDLKLILNLNLDKILSLHRLVNNNKFSIRYLKKIKRKIIKGKIHSIYFDDLYFDICYILCNYELKSILNFLIINKNNLSLIKLLVNRLDELGIKMLKISDKLEINKSYTLDLGSIVDGTIETIYTDGNVELGGITGNSYTERIKYASYIIFLNRGYKGNNIIVLSDLNSIYDKLPTIEQLNSHTIDLEVLKNNTKTINTVLEILNIKGKIIEVEGYIKRLLKGSNNLNINQKENLRQDLTGLYDLIKCIKSIESDLIQNINEGYLLEEAENKRRGLKGNE